LFISFLLKAGMGRKEIPDSIETQVLTLSNRRCALCFGLSKDLDEKVGQIAHLDKNPENNVLDNLVFLCFPHHDKYDSTTSQSKNYTKGEIKNYRDSLYKYIQSHNIYKKSQNEIQILNKYLTVYHDLFKFLFTTGEESAYLFKDTPLILAEDIVETWFCSKFKCNDSEIQQYQNLIYENLAKILNNIIYKYEYTPSGAGIVFKWQDDQEYNSKFNDIKKEMGEYIRNIKNAWDILKTFLA
jgi:hypothetical protein